MENNKKILEVYKNSSFFVRALVFARPYICSFEPIFKHIPAQKKILDVGCGVGSFLVHLAMRGKLEVGLGIDLNAKSIRQAQAAAKELGCGSLSFDIVENFEKKEFEYFDIVSMIDVMHHVPPNLQKQFFENYVNKVKYGGLLIYKDMAMRPLWKSWVNRLHDLVLARQVIHYVSLSDIEDWTRQLGFILQEKKCYSQLAYAHELLVFKRKE